MRLSFGFAARLLAVSGCAAALAASALANPTAVAQFKDWQVFTQDVSGETICYAATEATDKAPREASHGDVWFYVTNWSSGRARNQPSLRVGYDLREDLPSKARVGRSAWNLFNVGTEAFADDDDDPQIVRALERGSELRVESVSARGTSVAYHFSLSGSANAIDKARDVCR
ncbi:MAG: invasion associated locus B family protein [Pseudomonadota bacterium]